MNARDERANREASRAATTKCTREETARAEHCSADKDAAETVCPSPACGILMLLTQQLNAKYGPSPRFLNRATNFNASSRSQSLLPIANLLFTVGDSLTRRRALANDMYMYIPRSTVYSAKYIPSK